LHSRASPWLLVLVRSRQSRLRCSLSGSGLLVFRRRGESGAYFSMITLALALLAYQVANSWESVTGASTA
jgi:ABC-type branched-subunit amino acid transport system permease subunit